MTLQDYKDMVAKFNVLSFRQKLLFIKANADILTLASDGNWWVVRLADEELADLFSDNHYKFQIENEWGYYEMCTLVELLGLENEDI